MHRSAHGENNHHNRTDARIHYGFLPVVELGGGKFQQTVRARLARKKSHAPPERSNKTRNHRCHRGQEIFPGNSRSLVVILRLGQHPCCATRNTITIPGYYCFCPRGSNRGGSASGAGGEGGGYERPRRPGSTANHESGQACGVEAA